MSRHPAHATLPTYDFLTGASSPPPPAVREPLRETMRQSQAGVRPDFANEDLRAQVNKLQYELDTLRQERELRELQYQQDLREVQNRAEADSRKAQGAESSTTALKKRNEELQQELRELSSRSETERLELQAKVRASQEKSQSLQEELDEAQTELASIDRQSKHRYNELETRHRALQNSFNELRTELETKASALKSAQQKLVHKEAEADELEAEVIKLRSSSGDQEVVALLKGQLSEQVAHIKKLEATNREQSRELEKFCKTHQSIAVVEEEKRVLEGKLRLMDNLRRELGESEIRRQVLEDERNSWAAYLENEASGDLQFDSPEEMARAFMKERLENASLVDQLGTLRPELTLKDERLQVLEDQVATLQKELEKLRGSAKATPSSAIPTTATSADSKARARLERQQRLAVKEVEYLRAQLQNMDIEESEMTPEAIDAKKVERIQTLESLVDEHRNEIQMLHAELSAAEEALSKPNGAVHAGSKRAHPDDDAAADDERVGELRRKNRALQDALAEAQTRCAVLEGDVKALSSQVSSLKKHARTRVLELKRNPTADLEALKLRTVRHLREENAALKARLEGEGAWGPGAGVAVAPQASLDAAEDRIIELETALASAEKKSVRLKQIFASKSLEFTRAVASLLGWRMKFLPQGRFRVTSIFHLPPGADDGDDGEGGADSGENSIVFDGEAGTMKVSGGEESAFANEIRELIVEWVERKKEVPCFLAALTLEFWERQRREQEAREQERAREQEQQE